MIGSNMSPAHGAPTRAQARPSHGLSGRLRAPGDKSVSHRAILFGALATGETTITGLLEGDDVMATIGAARALGAKVLRDDEGVWRVVGVGEAGLRTPVAALDFGNSGTGCRLTMGAVAGHPIEATFVGDASLSGRPMERILEPLRAMGAVAHATNGGLPATLRGRPPLRAIAWISKTASAQVKSAVLLAGLAAHGETEFVEPRQSRDHTERLLRRFGAVVEADADGATHWRRISGPCSLTAAHVDTPSDPSSAAFLAAAALVTPDSDVTLLDVMSNPTRVGFYETLFDMGAALDVTERDQDAGVGGEASMDVRVRTAALSGVEIPTERAPAMIDEYPILAVCAAFATGRTVMRGAGELRVKESDRIAATAALLRAGGVAVEEFDDGLAVTGCGPDGVPGGGLVETHGDHRIAMSALVLGLGAKQPMLIDDSRMIATSYPNFFAQMQGMGALMSEEQNQ